MPTTMDKVIIQVFEDVPTTWRRWEALPSHGEPVEFEFFWMRFPDHGTELSGGQDELLSELVGSV